MVSYFVVLVQFLCSGEITLLITTQPHTEGETYRHHTTFSVNSREVYALYSNIYSCFGKACPKEKKRERDNL